MLSKDPRPMNTFQLKTLLVIFVIYQHKLTIVESTNRSIANFTHDDDDPKFFKLDVVNNHFDAINETILINDEKNVSKHRYLELLKLELAEIKQDYMEMLSKKSVSVKHDIFRGMIEKLEEKIANLEGKPVRKTRSTDSLTQHEWQYGPPPNYKLNVNHKLKATFQNYETCAKHPPTRHIELLDYWGEGLLYFEDKSGLHSGFADAYNVNHQYKLVSNGVGQRGRKIPNRIPLRGFEDLSLQEMYAGRKTKLIADVITVMSAPVVRETVVNMLHILNTGVSKGHIICYGFEDSHCPDNAREKISFHQENGRLYRFSDFINATWYQVLQKKGPPYLPTIWGSRVDRIRLGEIMTRSSCLVSTNGHYGACFKSDGNFVIYYTESVGHFSDQSSQVWSSNTCQHCDNKFTGPGHYLHFSHDGNIYIDDSANKHIWTSQTKDVEFTSNAALVMQNDGNLVLYTDNTINRTMVFCTKGCENSGFKFDGYSPCFSNKDASGAQFCRTNEFQVYEGVDPNNHIPCGHESYRYKCANTSTPGWTPCYHHEDVIALGFTRIRELVNDWCKTNGFIVGTKSRSCGNGYQRFRCRKHE